MGLLFSFPCARGCRGTGSPFNLTYRHDLWIVSSFDYDFLILFCMDRYRVETNNVLIHDLAR